MPAGLYLVQLMNESPISVNANDPRRPDCLMVDRRHCKVGKARQLAGRKTNYQKVFGDSNVVFTPLVEVDDIKAAEHAVLARLKKFRMRGGAANRIHEWLENIRSDDVIKAVFDALRKANIDFKPLVVEP